MTKSTAKSTKGKANKKVDFEKSLEQLEDIVAALENGDLSLEQSLKQFEQGVALTQQCQTALNDAAIHGVQGKEVTPYLLDRIYTLTAGRSLRSQTAKWTALPVDFWMSFCVAISSVSVRAASRTGDAGDPRAARDRAT